MFKGKIAMTTIETVSERIIGKIKQKLESRGYEIALKSTWANVGRIFIYRNVDIARAYAEISYDFQAETYTLTLTVNNKRIPSQIGRDDYFEFYQKYSEGSEFWNALRDYLPPV